MITCDTARELLLEAEPAELRGEGDGRLAAHLRGCPACRQRAAFLLAQTELLRDTLATLRPVEGRPGFLAAAGGSPGGMTRRWPVLVPLALAAGIAALLLVSRHEATAPDSAALQLAAATPPALDVQVPTGQAVAVFQTANPNIVVIWSY